MPVLQARSSEAEQLRRCPDETIEDFVVNGLLRICQPPRYGGYGLGWDVLCQVSQRLARGCGSQAWVQNVFADHAQKVGTFPQAAQEDVWSRDPNTRISASFDPVGKARRVPGGVRYSGRHGFSSGIDHAQWIICGGHILPDEGAPQRCFFLLPKSDVTIIDDWFVLGLCGTGSKSFEATDVFVPEHRILRAAAADQGTGPGTEVNKAPVFRLPRGGITSTGFAAVGIGIAQGFLEEYVSYTRPRKSRGISVAELAATQIGVGVACAEIESAAFVYLASAREAMQVLSEGKRIDDELKLRAKRDSAYACQVALNAVLRLFNAAGGRALSQNGAMQRQVRDLLGVASHHSLVWDNIAGEYGKLVLKSGFKWSSAEKRDDG